MKQRKIIKVVWTILVSLVALSMIMWTLAPAL